MKCGCLRCCKTFVQFVIRNTMQMFKNVKATGGTRLRNSQQNGIGISLDFKHYSSTFEFEQSDHCKMELKGGNWKNKRYSTFQYAFFQY